MQIFDTLSGGKKALPAPGGRPFRMFVCGPTVYGFSHIGHARTYIFFDLVARYLKNKGHQVQYLQNITDIDDKIIERAHRENTDHKNLAAHFTGEYKKDMKALGIRSVITYAPASKYIKEIIAQIKALLEKDFAYTTSSGIYFEVKKFSDYGKLSRQNLDGLRSGYRIEPDPEKKDALDFAIWKFKKYDYEPSWHSPWGEGRPGWHIEDTAITEKHFGPQYNIHGGGIDLKFPHHEAEIAQEESLSGKKPLANIWMHTGFLLVGGEKMSKSLGNFITIRDFLEKYGANTLRILVLQHHYRSPLDYGEEAAEQAQSAWGGLLQILAKLRMIKKQESSASPESQGLRGSKKQELEEKIMEAEKRFHAAMQDDFNTPEAIAAIFAFISELQPRIYGLSKSEAREAEKFISATLKMLGFTIKLYKIPLKIQKIAKKRELCRGNKQFKEADTLRKAIEALGYTVEDTPLGPFVWLKHKNKT